MICAGLTCPSRPCSAVSGSAAASMSRSAAPSKGPASSAGAAINIAKERIESALTSRRDALKNAQLEAQLATEALDITLPGRGISRGSLHPVTIGLDRIEQLFRSIGSEVADGPEIETDWHNFTALNTPENHPARSMHDTF